MHYESWELWVLSKRAVKLLLSESKRHDEKQETGLEIIFSNGHIYH